MGRLLVHVEGETEETFVNEILAPHLYSLGYTSIGARLIGNSRQRDRRGGIRGWNAVRRDILRHLNQDLQALATTMVDFYALPQSGEKAWPGRALATSLPTHLKAATVEDALLADLCQELGHSPSQSRFRPFLMMHEFEGLLFSEPHRFSQGIGRPELSAHFQQIRNQFASPEDINDSPESAPVQANPRSGSRLREAPHGQSGNSRNRTRYDSSRMSSLQSLDRTARTLARDGLTHPHRASIAAPSRSKSDISL